ncbi:MAG TPA: hybrid sensor histidine kinase/response regulator [Candidatus Goldiibacteriota bacterium]|nr:hybrid sensor histidine kinase/response regulator [Candidatus Goldiibacteriota bacterium]
MNERRHIKVLLIEDNPGDVRLIWEILSDIRNSPFYLNVADTLFKGLQEIEKDRPDAILLDLSLPDSNGIYTLNRVRDKAKEIPVVVITGLDDEMTAIKSLSEGAQDYLVKGRTDSDLLKRALIYAIERNRLMGQLILNERRMKEIDTIKSNFISMIFHELLIPAVSIRSTVNCLERSLALKNDQSLAQINSIKNNTMKLFALMDDLIDTTEIEAGRFSIEKKKVDITELLKNNLYDLSAIMEEKGVRAINETPSEKINAMADYYRISQALTNLILNAVKFSHEGGIIHAGVTEENDGVRVYIRDEGAGISPEDKEAVFDTYFSSKAQITEKHKRIGIGLMVVKSIVSAHGGKVIVRSEGVNKGSEFSIILPK